VHDEAIALAESKEMSRNKIAASCIGAAVISLVGGAALHASWNEIGISFVILAILGYVTFPMWW
jgi:hypothetical protein